MVSRLRRDDSESSPKGHHTSSLFTLISSLYLASLVRLIVIPLLTWLVCGLFTQDAVLRTTMMIVAACPGAVMVTVMANQYDRDAVYTAEGTLQSTALSMITIPFLIWLLAK